MSPGEVSRAVKLRLAGELRVDLGSVERRAAAVASLAGVPAAETPDVAHVRGLALAFELERFYTAVEAMLVRSVQGLDGDTPRGHQWHIELLRASSVPVPTIRPALINADTAAALRDVLGFRHFARHAYDADPELPRLAVLASRVSGLMPALRASMGAVLVEVEAQR